MDPSKKEMNTVYGYRKKYFADEIGALKLQQQPKKILSTGEVGYIISGIKDAREVKVGDTITELTNLLMRQFKDLRM